MGDSHIKHSEQGKQNSWFFGKKHEGLGPVNQNFVRKILIIFLPSNLNIYVGCSKEPSHRDSSIEYLQHMFWLRNKKNNFHVRTLIWGPA